MRLETLRKMDQLTFRSRRNGRAKLLVAAVWLVAVSPAIGAQEPGAAQTDSQVMNLLQTGQYREAEGVLNRELRVRRADCRLLTLHGIAANGLHDPAQALISFRTALRTCPDYLPALEGAAQIEYAEKNPEAVTLLGRILKQIPEDPTSNAMLASVYRSEHNCDSALEHYPASAPLFEENPQLLHDYVSCLAETEQFSKAAQLVAGSLGGDPPPIMRRDLAFLEWKAGDTKAAMNVLQPLLTKGSDEAALELGSNIAEQMNDTPTAVALLRAAILLDPANEENYLSFARIAFAHSSYQVGIDVVNRGIERIPQSAALYTARGVLEQQLSESSEAISDFRQAHRLDPKLSFAMDAIGIVQSQRHQDSQALESFKQQARLHPDDALLQYLLSEALSQSSDAAQSPVLLQAIAAAKRSISADPRYQPAHDLLAQLYLRTDQPLLAWQTAARAATLDPEDDVAVYQELMAARKLGKRDELPILVQRLTDLKKRNERKQNDAHHYELTDDIAHR